MHTWAPAHTFHIGRPREVYDRARPILLYKTHRSLRVQNIESCTISARPEIDIRPDHPIRSSRKNFREIIRGHTRFAISLLTVWSDSNVPASDHSPLMMPYESFFFLR